MILEMILENIYSDIRIRREYKSSENLETSSSMISMSNSMCRDKTFLKSF